MKKLKDIDYKILFELIKNSRISDRKLAKDDWVFSANSHKKESMVGKGTD